MNIVDARGFSCPTPVLMVKKELAAAAPQALEVLVDSKCAVENVTRFGESRGYAVTCREEKEDFHLLLQKDSGR